MRHMGGKYKGRKHNNREGSSRASYLIAHPVTIFNNTILKVVIEFSAGSITKYAKRCFPCMTLSETRDLTINYL